MLQVVEQACTFSPDNGHGVIVLESDITNPSFAPGIEELGSAEARNLALGYAAKRGIGDPRINGNPSGAYPINSQGLSMEHVRGPNGEALPPQHPLMQPACYRIDIPVTRRLV